VTRAQARAIFVSGLVASLTMPLACADDAPPPPPTTTTTTTLAPPPGSIEGVSATTRAFVDAHREGRDADATTFFTNGAIAACGTREAFAQALGDVRRVTSLAYSFVGVGPGYTEDDGVGSFELQLVEVDAGTGAPYQAAPITVPTPMVRGPDGVWRIAAPFPPTVTTFC
jgi:hypothetical protein